MEYDYQRAVLFPSEVYIGRVKLQPPTLAQWRLLETINSPFVRGGTASLAELRMAMTILSTPASELNILRTKQFVGLSLAKHGQLLHEFLSESWRSPEVYTRESSKTGPGYEPCTCSASRLAMRALQCNAVAFNHRHIENVWELTIPEALYAITVYNELNGTEYESESEQCQNSK